MNPTEPTARLIRAWMRAHTQFVREVVQRLKTVTDAPIGQPYNGEDQEYLVTGDGVGYHVEYELDASNGMLEFKAIPGRFVPSNVGRCG